MTRRPIILVVEDEALLLSTVVEELADNDFEVIAASDGEEALLQIESAGALDVVLTDIRLPGTLDGWSIASSARKRFPGIPVVYTTGYAPEPGRPVEAGTILHKPYTLNALVEIMTKMTAKR